MTSLQSCRSRRSCIAASSLLAAVLLAATATAAVPAPEPADISEVRDTLQFLHDGRGHYVAIVPGGDAWSHFYYGDGKVFHAQRVFGGGREAETTWNRTFWEPRSQARWQASIDHRNGVTTVRCNERLTTLTPVDDATRAKLLEKAKFLGPRWPFQAHALARDDKGTYYYVDRGRADRHRSLYRVFIGPRGRMKPTRLVNVVSDSAGDIFATRGGQLRLVLDRAEASWIRGKRATKLVSLPVEENVRLIYEDLGVYLGQRLGTPCDDL